VVCICPESIPSSNNALFFFKSCLLLSMQVTCFQGPAPFPPQWTAVCTAPNQGIRWGRTGHSVAIPSG
jgi:hypothetical protein